MILAPHGPRPQGAAQGGLRGDPQGRASSARGSTARWSTSTTRPSWRRQKTHTIEAVVDRDRDPRRSPQPAGRVDQPGRPPRRRPGAGHARGEAARRPASWHDRLFSTQYACPNCKISYEELEPRTFSFNSPYGACPACEGLGARVAFDPELVVPDRGLLAGRRGDRAVERRHAGGAAEASEPCCSPFSTAAGVRWNTPLAKLEAQGPASNCCTATASAFPGCWRCWKRNTPRRPSEPKRQRLEAFRGEVACPECGGARLRPEARAVRLAGKAIHEVTALTVARGAAFFAGLEFPRAAAADRRADRPARSVRGWISRPGRAWTISRSTGPPTRSQRRRVAARAAGQRASARGWSASATCSTSPRSACTPATTSG